MANFVKTHITFRVTEEELDMITALAKANHLPIGTFIKREMRQLAHKEGSRARVDSAPVSTTTVIPAKPVARPVKPVVDEAALGDLFGDTKEKPPADFSTILDKFDDGE